MKFIDLYAGIGGFRLALESLGNTCVFSSEWDKYAQITYKENFGDCPHGDITKIDEATIPEHDILCAGFPCQPFSQAGFRKGLNDPRGTAFFDILRIAKYHKPKVLFLENVKALKGHDKGCTYKSMESSLKELGYMVHSKILNAKDFGLPQNRARLYIIALLDEVVFEFPEPTFTQTKVGDILDENVDDKYTISDRLWDGHQRRKEAHKNKGNGFGYSIFNHESTYTSTISARYYKDGSEILIEQKDKNPRKVTPREASRLQGFPESYKFTVSDVQAYKQLGNSVAVPVLCAIAKLIRQLFT